MTGRRNDTIDAFGNIVYQTGSLNQSYQYQTKEYDSQSGLVYFGARYYDPSIGRFTTPDPLGMVDGPNRYVYLANDPINLMDPWGLCDEDINESQENIQNHWYWYCDSGACVRIRKTKEYDELNWLGKTQFWLWKVSSNWHSIPGLPGCPMGNPINNPCYEIDDETPAKLDNNNDGIPDEDRPVI